MIKPAEYVAGGVATAVGGLSLSLATATALVQFLTACGGLAGVVLGMYLGYRKHCRDERAAELAERGAVYPPEHEV